MGIRGIVFDKDGTLFDFQATWGYWCAGFIRELAGTDEIHAAALAAALGFDRAAGRFHPASPVIAGTMEVVIAAALNALPGIEEAGLRRRVLETTAAAPQVEAAPLAALLDRLRGAGMTLGLATNDAEAPARAHLARAGVLDRFAFVAGYDSGHGGKPEPGMLEAFCRATGLPSAACAMVGDSAHDLASGRAAGMATVGVLTGPATAADLAPLADVVLPGVAALPAWLGLDG
ncbi:MAG: HAD family hydrolase [Amaricoccus sp.]|nr:HAD family hydrolase [Amaricoccus sp.]